MTESNHNASINSIDINNIIEHLESNMVTEKLNLDKAVKIDHIFSGETEQKLMSFILKNITEEIKPIILDAIIRAVTARCKGIIT